MKLKFQPLPEGESPLDVKQFLFRLKHDPGFAEKMRSHYEAALAMRAGPDTFEMQAAARKALSTLKHHMGAWRASLLLSQAMEMVGKQTPGKRAEHFKQMKALVDEAVDHLLDVQEPERTRIIAMATSIQEDVRKRLEDGG